MKHVAGPRHNQAKLLTSQPGLRSIQASNDFWAYLCNVSESDYAADNKAVLEKMAAVHTARRQDIVRFRSDIAAAAVVVGRGIQLGLGSSKLLMRLHGTMTAECDGQEALNALDEQSSEVGGLIVQLGRRNSKGKDGVAAMHSALTEARRLGVEKEKAEKDQKEVVERRVKIEEELEGLGCRLTKTMCRKCLELLRRCEECEEASVAWEKMSTK
jgi:hypothetical protein